MNTTTLLVPFDKRAHENPTPMHTHKHIRFKIDIQKYSYQTDKICSSVLPFLITIMTPGFYKGSGIPHYSHEFWENQTEGFI